MGYAIDYVSVWHTTQNVAFHVTGERHLLTFLYNL